MPYRSELKRPDLKGHFPCSVCGKIFCHSSSLSRHRMQAHFKSYTCTICHQEISSNETLRTHMSRSHGISRMFMCRCCNWAFPDKTSLHIHMQAMMRTGQPGEVAVLARSSTQDAPSSSSSDSPSPMSLYPLKMNNNTVPSIFPTLPRDISIKPPMLSVDFSSNQWLAAWLANNPFAPALGLGVNTAGKLEPGEIPRPAQSSIAPSNPSHSDTFESVDVEEDDDDDDEEDGIEIDCTEMDRKRKVEEEEEEENEEMRCKMKRESPSPSLSHVSESGDDERCTECQDSKLALLASQERVRMLETRLCEMERRLQALQGVRAPQPIVPDVKLLFASLMQSSMPRH